MELEEYLKRLNNRLVVIETTLSRMNNLRSYNCKAESKFGKCDSHPAFNEYNDDRRCIDFFINHLLHEKKHCMNLIADELKNSKLIEKDKKINCLTCLFVRKTRRSDDPRPDDYLDKE